MFTKRMRNQNTSLKQNKSIRNKMHKEDKNFTEEIRRHPNKKSTKSQKGSITKNLN